MADGKITQSKSAPTEFLDSTQSTCHFDANCQPSIFITSAPEIAATSKFERGKRFQFPPLDHSLRQVRLVEVLPPDSVGHVRCRMSVALIEESHTAVSYVWGTDPAYYNVEVNGQILRVRENIYNFLITSREIFPNTKLWIDTLCIDQSNTAERNHQVRMMGDIYGSAKHVISWLGCGDVRIREGFEFIRNECLPPLHLDRNQLRKQQKEPLWKVVYEICNLDYWTRLWIVQEVLNARKLSLMYDRTVIDFKRLCLFMNDVRYRRSCPAELKPMIESSKLTNFVKMKSEGGPAPGTQGMYELLCFYGLNLCSDVRDRIFALLPLAIDAQDFEVDYSLTRYDLFLRALSVHRSADVNNKLLFMEHMIEVLELEPLEKPTVIQNMPTVLLKCLNCSTHRILVREKVDDSWTSAFRRRLLRREDSWTLKQPTAHSTLNTRRLRTSCSGNGRFHGPRRPSNDQQVVYRRERVEAIHVNAKYDMMTSDDDFERMSVSSSHSRRSSDNRSVRHGTNNGPNFSPRLSDSQNIGRISDATLSLRSLSP